MTAAALLLTVSALAAALLLPTQLAILTLAFVTLVATRSRVPRGARLVAASGTTVAIGLGFGVAEAVATAAGGLPGEVLGALVGAVLPLVAHHGLRLVPLVLRGVRISRGERLALLLPRPLRSSLARRRFRPRARRPARRHCVACRSPRCRRARRPALAEPAHGRRGASDDAAPRGHRRRAGRRPTRGRRGDRRVERDPTWWRRAGTGRAPPRRRDGAQ